MAKYNKKVCLLGEFAVGKTSLIRRFVYDRFDDKYISTIGVKVSRKSIVIPKDGELIDLTMLLWDLAGNEEFSQVRASYLRGSSGAVLVCDLTRKSTLDNLHQYARDLRKISPDAHLILAANKVDLISDHQATVSDVKELAAHLESPFYLTSAKDGDEVEDLFRHLGKMLV
ncbi:MAG: Rab family GTPase [Chloroflexota bacterium]